MRGLRLLLDGVVGVFLNARVADDADEAFVQHRISRGLRLAVARHQRIGEQRHIARAGILHRVSHAEHILVIDRNRAGEDEALAIVPGEGHRLGARQCGCIGAPQRVGARHVQAAARLADEAGVHIVGIGRGGRREQLDDRAVGVHRLAVGLQGDVIDATALQGDRALQAPGVDGDARARGERGFAAQGHGRDRGGRRCGDRARCLRHGRDRGGGAVNGSRRRLGGLALYLRHRVACVVELGPGVEILPADNDQQR